MTETVLLIIIALFIVANIALNTWAINRIKEKK